MAERETRAVARQAVSPGAIAGIQPPYPVDLWKKDGIWSGLVLVWLGFGLAWLRREATLSCRLAIVARLAHSLQVVLIKEVTKFSAMLRDVGAGSDDVVADCAVRFVADLADRIAEENDQPRRSPGLGLVELADGIVGTFEIDLGTSNDWIGSIRSEGSGWHGSLATQ